MIQPQWPGLGPAYQPPTYTGGSSASSPIGFGSALGSTDGVNAGWWNEGGLGSSAGGGSSTTSSLLSVLQSLVGMLGSLVGSFMNGAASTNGGGPWPGQGGLPGQGGWSPPNGGTGSPPCAGPGCGTPPQRTGDPQRFSNVTISSMGDPHITENGTLRTAGGDVTVADKYDSMTSHQDLVDARSVAGGYQVATTVTQPNANGISWNQSASVYANGGEDAVTMNRDGSFAITSNGQSESIARGGSLTLSGGETVTENNDGSLAVSAANGRGGTIATTLRANDGGVDVTVTAKNLRLGGDVVAHGSGAGWDTPVRRTPPIADPPRHIEPD